MPFMTNWWWCTDLLSPKYTSVCQPCDVYFYRHFKQFIARLQNCAFLLQEKREISWPEENSKIHSLIHNQLSSLVFKDMLQYAWYASKLVDSWNDFRTLREVCFPKDVQKRKCKCTTISIIRCSWCFSFLCFACFLIIIFKYMSRKYLMNKMLEITIYLFTLRTNTAIFTTARRNQVIYY